MELFENFVLYDTITYATSGISIAFSTFLIILIISNKKQEVKLYRNILLESCFIDIWFALISALIVPQFETADYKLYFRMSTPWFPEKGIYSCIGIWIYQWSLLTLLLSMIIQPIFQYFIVLRRITLNNINMRSGQLFVLFVSVIITLPNICTPCNTLDSSDYKTLKEMGLWKHFPELYPSFRFAFYRQFWFILNAFSLFLLIIFAYIGYFLLTWKIKKYLKLSKALFSAKTIILYNQFEKNLFLKSIMPCFSFLFLTIIFFYIYALPLEYANIQGGFLMAAFIPLNFITVFNPIITLFTIKTYRDSIFSIKKKTRINVVVIM